MGLLYAAVQGPSISLPPLGPSKFFFVIAFINPQDSLGFIFHISALVLRPLLVNNDLNLGESF